MSETVEGTLLERLDRLTLLLELALAPQLKARRAELREDPVDAAIFDATASEWIAAADLQKKVAATAKAKPRTIQRRLSALIETGLVVHKGGTRYAKYRSAGLI